jgi:Ca2+-binding RTX toxin-like protein
MTIDLSAGLGYVTGYVAGADHLKNFENAVGGNLNDTLIGDTSANTLDGGAGDDILIGRAGADILNGGEGSDTFIYYLGDGNDVIKGGANVSGTSWTDTIDLHGTTASLGTYGVDWTVTVDSGAITSADNTNHVLTLSADASGSIHMQDGAVINFSEIERIAWA